MHHLPRALACPGASMSASWLSLTMECGECHYRNVFKDIPDLVMVHLIKHHAYTVGEAYAYIKDWERGLLKSEHGVLLEDCPRHGLYEMGTTCPGCDAIDDAVERWKERRTL